MTENSALFAFVFGFREYDKRIMKMKCYICLHGNVLNFYVVVIFFFPVKLIRILDFYFATWQFWVQFYVSVRGLLLIIEDLGIN